MVQPGQGERPAEPAALLAGIDPDHVDLPGTRRRRARRRAGVRRSFLLARRVHLGPVETRHPAVPFRDEETRRVEPRLPLPQLEVVPGPAALFGMLGEGPAVEAQPLVLILARDEGAQRPAGRQGRRVEGAGQLAGPPGRAER